MAGPRNYPHQSSPCPLSSPVTAPTIYTKNKMKLVNTRPQTFAICKNYVLILLYFALLLAASSDHPCLALDGFSIDAVANSRMVKCKRCFHGNSTSVGTLYAGHEKSARTKVHMCSHRRVTLLTILEFAKQRDKTVATVLTIVYTFNHSFHKYESWNFNSGNYLFTTDTK